MKPFFTVKYRQEGLRLFEVMASELNVSKKKAQAMLDAHQVLVNGKRIWMKNHLLKENDRVEILVTEAPTPTPRRMAILWQDADYLIVNKAPHMLTNASDESVEACLRTQEKIKTIYAVHRLDRETSGCVLFAKSAKAKTAAIPMFKGRDIMKIYRAIAIGSFPKNRKEMRTDIDGYMATTRVKTLDSNSQASYVELRIETGRTHQIRRHLADHRHPVMGDKRYAGSGHAISLEQPRQMLHAYRLVFPHPKSGQMIRATAPLPADFKRCLSRLKLR